jgi:hypothetical protein
MKRNVQKMSADTKRLVRALRSLPAPNQFYVRAAAIILAVNGIDSALEYVEAVRLKQKPVLPLEAAEEMYFQGMDDTD